ncbi:glycosyltransferase A (GT-A) superfamily protein (DUF2064 family) [Catenulispora sp. GP43]|uniref:TIGR04282 family arsenosugar biosynthesis glycosyltransferase n=1 Tax=Catenulispora sp. GP43 TaxID=3156263 RepID=UPI0035137C25
MSTLIVIAKTPVPGRVKTRLTPPFTPPQAAALAEAALEDTLRAVLETDVEHRLLVLDGAPRAPWQRDFTVLPQVPGTLDRRLAAAFAQAALRDPGPVLLVGMDTPQITAGLLRSCLPGAEDATLGLADDGGFWCLGFRKPRSQDLQAHLLGVPMSTDHTGRDQLGRLRAGGLRVRLVPTLRDVDTVEDAEHVAALVPRSRFGVRFRTLRRFDAPAGAGSHR